MSTTKTSAALRPHPRPEGWWAYPLIYLVAAYLTAFIPGLTAWAFLGMGVAVGLFGALAARLMFDATTYGVGFASGASWCAGLAGVTAGIWMLLAEPHPERLWQWLALWFAVFGSWYYLLGLIAPKVAAGIDAQFAALPVEPGPEVPADTPYPGIIARAQVGDVRVDSMTVSPSGGVETVHLRPVRQPGKKSVTYAGFLNHVDAIATEAALEFEQSRGIDIADGDVVPERGRNMGEFLLHFTVQRVHEGRIPFVMEYEPQPWASRWLIGQYEDDRPLELVLCDAEEGARHLDVVGKTGSGKGVLLGMLIARLTSSDEGEVWLVGTEKLVKLAWGWLLPWLRGETDRPVIDRVGGESLDEALTALADALHYAKLCNQRVPTTGARKATRGKGALTVMIDEASKVLGTNKKWPTHDGRQLTASEMVAEIKSLGRTALVNVVIANQDQLFSSFGAAGSNQQRNTDIGIALQVKRRDDADKVLAGLDGHPNAQKLRNKQFYVTTGEADERSMRAKAQSLLDDTIPVVAAHNTRWRYGLDPDITKLLRTYADRWNPRRHAELIEAAHLHGLEWPVTEANRPGDRPAPDDRPAPGDRPAPAEPSPAAPAQPAPAGDRAAAPAGDLPPLPPAGDVLPPGWAGDFDIWAAFDAAGDGAGDTPADQVTQASPAPGGHLPAPDTSGIEAAGRRMLEAMREHQATARPALPEPLGIILVALDRPGAPAEWVATQRLAEVIQRVPRDASPEAKRRAAEVLGRELSTLDPHLQPTSPRRMNGERLRGFLVADLRAAAERLRGA